MENLYNHLIGARKDMRTTKTLLTVKTVSVLIEKNNEFLISFRLTLTRSWRWKWALSAVDSFYYSSIGLANGLSLIVFTQTLSSRKTLTKPKSSMLFVFGIKTFFF
jgi:hypothetical protein